MYALKCGLSSSSQLVHIVLEHQYFNINLPFCQLLRDDYVFINQFYILIIITFSSIIQILMIDQILFKVKEMSTFTGQQLRESPSILLDVSSFKYCEL